MEFVPARQSQSARIEFIDLLRGWAVFVMIETHVTNGLLAMPYRAAWWFNPLDFFNGLVAPSFLFCAGCGLWLAINRKWDDYVRLRPPFWKYMRRMAWILAVAYALHLPNFSLRRLTTNFSSADAETLFQVDILHTIVATLVFSLLIVIVTRRKNVLLWVSIIFSALLIVFAPQIWAAARTAQLSVLTRDMLTEMPGSYFPFVPWSAFVFIGVILTKLYMDAPRQSSFFRRLFILGVILTVAGTICRYFFNPYSVELWRATPIFFAMRLGLIFIAFSALWYYSERTKTAAANKKFRLFLLFGRESLLVYVVHIIIVYGSVANNGIAAGYARSFTPFQCVVATVILITAMAALAYIWRSLKTDNPNASRAVQYSIAIVFLAFLVLNK